MLNLTPLLGVRKGIFMSDSSSQPRQWFHIYIYLQFQSPRRNVPYCDASDAYIRPVVPLVCLSSTYCPCLNFVLHRNCHLEFQSGSVALVLEILAVNLK